MAPWSPACKCEHGTLADAARTARYQRCFLVAHEGSSLYFMADDGVGSQHLFCENISEHVHFLTSLTACQAGRSIAAV